MFAKFDCFLPLSMWLTDRLDGQSVASEPTTGTLQIKLTQAPKAGCYCIPGRMKSDDPIACVDVDMDPLKLLDVPYDKEAFGEFSKRIVHQATSKLGVQNFEIRSFLETQEQAFADAGYVYRWIVHKKKLPKSLGDAKIIASTSATMTKCEFLLEVDGAVEFKKTIWEFEGVSLLANALSSIIYSENKFVIVSKRPRLINSVELEVELE